MKILTISLLCFITLPQYVLADATLQYKNENKPEALTISLTKENLKIDQFKNKKLLHSILYSKQKDMIYILDHANSSYFNMDEAKAKKMQKKIGSMMQQMQAAMANVPPEMRAAVEKQMQAQLGTSTKLKKQTPSKLIKVASNVKVKKWNTTEYKVQKNKKDLGSVWTATNSELGIDQDSLLITKDLFKLLNKIANNFQYFSQHTGKFGVDSWSKLNGIPVKSKFKRKSREDAFILEEIKSNKIDAAIFAMPAKYKERKIPGMN